MPKKKPADEDPSADELREAAAKRAPTKPKRTAKDSPQYGQLVAKSFAAGPTSSRSVGRARTHTISPVRITETMANALADYGNDHELNPSDTVRSLLAEALDLQEEDQSP